MAESGLAIDGRCLCGAAKFRATLRTREADACHCDMCRRWAGGVFISVRCEAADFEDETVLTVYRSSDVAERVSCGQCGSTLMWRTVERDWLSVSTSAFDDSEPFVLREEIFIDEKPGYYDFATPTHKVTGAEAVAQFMAERGTGNG